MKQNDKIIITKIKKTQKKVTVFFKYEKIDFSPEVLSTFYLYEGKELSEKELTEIKFFSSTQKLYQYCVSLLTKKLYSEHKIREKLYLKEAHKNEVDFVINRLKQNQLLDDMSLAEEYQLYLQEQGYGKNKIILKLMNKDVFKEQINALTFPREIEKENAIKAIKKMNQKYDKYNNANKKKHIIDALLSLGFDQDVIFSVESHITYSDSKQEVEKLKIDFKKTLLRYQRKYQNEELKKHVVSSLITKGYHYDIILSIWEDQHDKFNGK